MSVETTTVNLADRRLPPVAQLGAASLALIIAGGIYLAANLPHHVSLAPATALLAAAAGLLVINMILLSRVSDFAWRSFLMVGARALAAYVVISGMIEYVFIYDHTRGSVLSVLTLMLIVFAIDPPLIIAFTVARYQQPKDHPDLLRAR